MGWWSTTLWMARKYRWRRPCKLVTLWCIPSLKGSSMRAGLAKLTHDIIKLYKEESWRRRRRTPARRSRRPMILTEVIMMSQNSMVSSSWLPLPSTRSLTTKPHDLNVFRHVERIKKNFDINHHHNSISHPSWRKIQPKWHILSNMSAISLVFSSKLSSPSTVSKILKRFLIFQGISGDLDANLLKHISLKIKWQIKRYFKFVLWVI